MPQRNSEYARKADDCYVTPQWVWDALYSVAPWAASAFDCAPISRDGYDFLEDWDVYDGIATNPPYKIADQFVRHALDLPNRPPVAMLLPHSWDCAKSRVDLFTDRRFLGKFTLTKRIKWDNIEHVASPSSNHAWFIWRSEPRGFVRPIMGWLT